MLHNFSMNNLLRSIAHKLSLQTPSILKGLKKIWSSNLPTTIINRLGL